MYIGEFEITGLLILLTIAFVFIESALFRDMCFFILGLCLLVVVSPIVLPFVFVACFYNWVRGYGWQCRDLQRGSINDD